MENIISIIKINTVLFLKNKIILFLSSMSSLNIENNILYFLFAVPTIKTISRMIDKISADIPVIMIAASPKLCTLLPSPKHKFHTICSKIEYFNENLYAM